MRVEPQTALPQSRAGQRPGRASLLLDGPSGPGTGQDLPGASGCCSVPPWPAPGGRRTGATWPAAPQSPAPTRQTDNGTGRGQPWEQKALSFPSHKTRGPHAGAPAAWPECPRVPGGDGTSTFSQGQSETHSPALPSGVGWACSGPPASPQLGITGGTVKWAAALDSSLQPLKVAQSHHVAQPATFPKTEQGSRKNLHANVHSGSAQPPEAAASPGVHRRVSAWTDVLAGGVLLV